MKKWYVVKAINGREKKVLLNINTALREARRTEEVEELLIPVEKVTDVKRSKKVTVEKILYPGYIYALMEPTVSLLELIRSADGVSGFLGSSPSTPTPLIPSEVEQIMKIVNADSSEEQKAATVNIPYTVGEIVKVKEGTFAGMEGEIEDINAQKGTIRVMITVFGRRTPVELEAWQVEEV